MRKRSRTPPGPLDRATLDELALVYVARYATSTGRLAAYLTRKIRERGWAGDGDAGMATEQTVADMVARRYVDDRHFAVTRGAALQRRGYGARRIADQLRHDGLGESDRAVAIEDARDAVAAIEAALVLARRRRLGPFGRQPDPVGADPRTTRERAIGAFLRAGHDLSLARRILDWPAGSEPTPDDLLE